MLSGKHTGYAVRKIASVIGIIWMSLMVAIGIWLGITGLFFGAAGLVFESGYGDIWILAILAAPGYFLWKWASATSEPRSEEHTSELQSLMRISYAVFCLK